jgi:hypothetical protein
MNNFTCLCYATQTSHQFIGSQFHNKHATTKTKPHMTTGLKMMIQRTCKQKWMRNDVAKSFTSHFLLASARFSSQRKHYTTQQPTK